MSNPVFGLMFPRVDAEPRPVIAADMSTAGFIGPADGADVDFYPLNEPVLIFSNDTVATGKLGTSGYLRDAVEGVNAQLGDLEVAARIVIVRTANGTNADAGLRLEETIGNIMGSSVDGDGIWAFVRAPEVLGVTPRLITAPGYTSQMANSVDHLTIGTIGTGYRPGTSYPITFTGGGTSPTIVQATGHAVANANGEIRQANLTLDTLGAFYASAPTATLPIPPAVTTATLTVALDGTVTDTAGSLIAGATGNGYVPGQTYAITFAGGGVDAGKVLPTGHAVANEFGEIGQAQLFLDSPGDNLTQPPTATIPAPAAAVRGTLTAPLSAGANPVNSMLPPILNQLLAHAVVESAGTSLQNDTDWRETINSQRIIAVTGGVRVFDSVTNEVVIRPRAPREIGIIIRRDHETGAPFHSGANQPIQGIVGPGRNIGFSLLDGANEGQTLLSFNIGIIARGEVGSDVAISNGGFISIATDVCSDDPLWKFYNVTRGRDFIILSLIPAERVYLGRFNITGNTVQALLNTVGFFLRDLQADEHILGYKVGFKGSQNSAEEIRLGHIVINWAAEEPPVLTRIENRNSRYRPAIDAMVQQLERSLNIAA